jgi:hypothetical protein
VFDDELRETLMGKYGGRPNSQRPECWLIATSPERADQRAWMNRALMMLDEPGRSKLWTRLTDDNHFLQTYNELAVAAILQEGGLRPSYQIGLDGLSPDLTLLNEAGQPGLLVELTNRLRSKNTAFADHRWRGLRDRVSAIPAPYGVLVANASPDLPAPTDDLCKSIARQLRSWLLSPPIASGDVLQIEEYLFRIGTQLPGTNAQLIYSQVGDWVDSDEDVTALVEEKLKKYAPLAKDLEVPLVVVISADPRVPLDVEIVRAAMRGQSATTTRLDVLLSSSPTTTLPMHQTDKPPAWDPALSAVGWLTPGRNSPGMLSLFPTSEPLLPHGLPLGGRLDIDRGDSSDR